MGVHNLDDIQAHPKLGASWDGFALEQIIQLAPEPESAIFFSDYQDFELYLHFNLPPKRIGFEFKYTSKPKLTESMRKVEELLHLDASYVVYPGENRFF